MVTRSMRMWLHRDGAPPARSAARAALGNQKCPFSGKAVRDDCLTLHKGAVVGFCNPKCRDKFAHDPERYAAMKK